MEENCDEKKEWEKLDEVTKVILPQYDSWPETIHLFDEKSKWAVKAAMTAGRPLLIRGEPGTGKSQLARAVAEVFQRTFIAEVVHARSECQDLQWNFDTVARLGEAQAMGTSHNKDIKKELDTRRFLSPGALWWAFNWNTAEKQYAISNKSVYRPKKNENWASERGSVLLIDEIDKADADLPNGLLETLGNGAFSVPYIEETVGLEKGIPLPLVIITTNEERELPRAFLRRCMVLHMELPKDDEELSAFLVNRGKAHFDNQCTPEIMLEVAEQLIEDRNDARRLGQVLPGQAEYLDILRALNNMSSCEEEQRKALKEISDFALVKYPKADI